MVIVRLLVRRRERRRKKEIINEGKKVENNRKRKLLKEQKYEVYILETTARIKTGFDLELDNASLEIVDEHCIEVTVSGGLSINEVFGLFTKADIKIDSMRNKTNRLEQLFLSKLESND